MSNWYNQTLRKVHLLYVSPQWAERRGEDFDADQYADAYAKAEIDTVQVYAKDHHGVCYFPCSLGLPYGRDIVGELLAALRKRNIRMLAYVSMFFDNYACGIHPDWRAVNEAGDPHRTGPFSHISICSPYQDFLLTQLRELVDTYDVDGYWLDIIPLARNEPQPLWMIQPHPVPDYSVWAQRRYRAAANRNLPKNPTPQQRDDIFEFMTAEVDAFMRQAFDTIRARRPGAVVTYNAAGSPGDPLDMGDLVSIEGHAPHYWRQSFLARWGKTSPKPFELMIAGGLSRTDVGGGWNAVDQKPAAMLQLEAAIVVANGGNPVIGQVPYPSGRTDPGQFATFEKVYPRIRDLEPWLVDTTPISDVGIVLASKPRTASSHWLRMKEGAEAAHRALLDEHLQFRLVRLGASDLSAYQALVLLDQTALSDREITQIRNYVERGGTLIASGATSLFDERGQQRYNFGLADVFGVSYGGDLDTDFVYLQLDEETFREQVTPVPILVDGASIRIRGNATSLGSLIEPETWRTDATTVLWADSHPDLERQYPGLTEHRFGNGRCFYLAFAARTEGLPNTWIKLLVRRLCRRSVALPVLSTTAGVGIELVLNRQRDRLVLHAINHHAGDPDRLSLGDNPLLIRGAEVEIDVSWCGLPSATTVRVAPEGIGVDCRRNGDRLSFTLPEFSIHSLTYIT